MSAPNRDTWQKFIVVEGLDGAGTSTQSVLLERALQAAGIPAVLSMEPTPGPIGTLIKQIMRGRLRSAGTRELTERQLAHLFAADRFDHLYNDVDGIRATIDRGRVAISTRYFFSSQVYNGRTPEMRELVERLNADFPLPQILVYLAVPLSESLRRLEKRDVREFYEHEEELRRVAAAYEELLAGLGERVLRYESVGDAEALGRRIATDVIARL
jgi:dTMP kinase